MRLTGAASGHLGYCTNVHPGEAADDVLHHVATLVPQVKAAFVPDTAMGVGLRVAARAAFEFEDPRRLALLQEALTENDLYVYTINGFPYGNFHHGLIKEKVYQPDWRNPQRVRYTIALARLLASLLPDDVEYGSISTVPCGFRRDLRSDDDLAIVAAHLLQMVETLARLRDTTGKTIVIALEPEPCCHLETIPETVTFFERWIFCRAARVQLMRQTGVAAAEAECILHRHLAICVDLCHLAVEFETPREALAQLSAAGIGIGKVQISAGLRVSHVDASVREQLKAYDDGIYLHQVVARRDGGLVRYLDLNEALASLGPEEPDPEWRIHFHVPVFADDLGRLSSTRREIEDFLALHAAHGVCAHLEVETYTWNVVPPALRESYLPAALARELRWVRTRLRQ